jgi:seryl-tRNA synthetase
MLDIKFVRENSKLVEDAIKNKKSKADLTKILVLDEKKRDLSNRVELLRKEKNELAKSRDNIDKAKTVKKMLQDLEPQLTEVSEELLELMYHLPNVPATDVKVGRDESENEIIKTVGEPRKFDFKIKDHMELGKSLDLIDTERASKVSGSRFSYLKNQAVIIEFSLIRMIMDMLQKEGFTPIIPPVLEKMETAKGTGYFEALSDDAYHTTEDEMVLVGTSEQSILPYYMDEIIEGDLPKRFVSFSTCFRREAGSYGKDVAGIMRQHQFDKVEMVVFCDPNKSDQEHEFILSIEEKIMQALELPYQVVKMCTGDLGAPATRKYDIEAWVPSQGKYRELTSCSTCTDFQSRRLNIRHKAKEGKTELVYTLNGTGSAIGRTLVALFENHQQADGSILIPKALQKYCGFDVIK